MSESFSQVSLLGALRSPVRLEALPSGAQCGTFELLLRKQTTSGAWYTTIIPCLLLGKHLEQARLLAAGQACLFSGEISRRKVRDGGYELCVSGWQLEPLELPAPLRLAANNDG